MSQIGERMDPRRIRKEYWTDLIKELEGTIPIYDRINKIMTGGWDSYWRRVAAAKIYPEDHVLEVGSGPGTFAQLLSCRRVTLIDPSPVMARFSSLRLLQIRPDHTHLVGTAENLPLRNQSVDRAFCIFSFRDFYDKELGLSEIFRVLKKGGELIICDLAKVNKIQEKMGELFLNHLGMGLARWLGGRNHPFRGLFDTYRAFGFTRDYLAMLKKVGFSHISYRLLFPGGAGIFSAYRA